jgi:hypothetical protein
MKFPLSFNFKIIALGNRIFARDADGRLIGYASQKLFKLKEDIRIFADESQTQLVYNIKADRIIDFSARYTFYDGAGRKLGSIKRQGMRSIWKAEYELYDVSGSLVMKINEENAWRKVGDYFLSEIPLVGFFTGYFMNPSYIITRANGGLVARLDKQPAMFESKFELSANDPLSENEETLLYLGTLMMTILERTRG